MDWFLYDRDPRHERVKSTFLISKKNYLGHFNPLATNIPIM